MSLSVPDCCSGVLLLEELVSSAKLPHDTRRGLYDPTHRGYVLHVRRDPKEVAVGKPPDECVVLAGAARFPAQDVHAGVGTCAHSQRVPQPAHLGLPLGPEMASGAFTRRLPLIGSYLRHETVVTPAEPVPVRPEAPSAPATP